MIRMRWVKAALVAAALLAAPVARAEGLWSTYLHASSCNDILALRDTVWMATGDAGLLRYHRSTDSWSTITREPDGLAGNDVQAITFDRSGNLFAAVPGKGVSRLDTDGHWSLINAFDGLPSDTVLVLHADGDTVWIGTTRGLALWDGKTVAGSVPDLGTPSPFSNNNINGLAVTGDTLVVSTPEGIYVARLSQRLATWNLINGTLPLLNQDIRGIASDGRVLLALVKGNPISNPTGVIFTSFRWSPSTNSWPTETPGSGLGQSVRRLRDDHGIIVATTLAGTHLRTASGVWIQSPNSPATDNGDVAALEPAADPDGVLFTSTAGKLAQEPSWTALAPPGPVGNTSRNVAWVNGTVYVCYAGEGIGRLRDGVWRNYPASGTNCVGAECDTTFTNSVFPAGMLVDPLGSRWIAMWGGPLTRFSDETSPPVFQNIFYASSNADSAHLHSTIHAAAADSTNGTQAGRWFGLDSDRIGNDIGNPLGLDLYDQDGRFIRNYDTTYPGLRNGLIRALVCDRSNKMWVGYKGSSSAGLSTFQVPENLQVGIELTDVLSTNRLDVFGLATVGDSVWVLATDGLYRYRQSTAAFVSKLEIAGPPALASMHPLAVAPNGTVFVGTTGGMRVHRRGRLPVDYTPDNSPIADVEVRGLYCEPSGAVWIATASGVNRFDPEYIPPPEPKLPSLTVKLYPNPAWLTGAGFELRLAGQATSYVGEVFDLNGRVVHRFSIGGNGSVFWGGRDLDQQWVGPGVYFVRVRGGGAEATSRVVVLR